jgi:hypothetical protein
MIRAPHSPAEGFGIPQRTSPQREISAETARPRPRSAEPDALRGHLRRSTKPPRPIPSQKTQGTQEPRPGRALRSSLRSSLRARPGQYVIITLPINRREVGPLQASAVGPVQTAAPRKPVATSRHQATRSIPGRALAFDVGFPLSGSSTGLTPPISTSVPGTPPLAYGSLREKPPQPHRTPLPTPTTPTVGHFSTGQTGAPFDRP